MSKKDQVLSTTPTSGGHSIQNGGIRIVADNVKAARGESKRSLRKETSPDDEDADGDDDDMDDFPFFAPPSSSMLQQRANPPSLPAATTTMSPKTTNPRAMPQYAAEAQALTLTTSHSSSKESKEKKRPKGISKSSPPSRTPSASPSTPLPYSASQQLRQRGGSPSSPADDRAPSLPPRPGGPRRSSSQDGNFFSKVKKGKEQVQAGGLKAASFLDKVSHVAWDKIKSPRLNPTKVSGRSCSPQSSNKYDANRDTSNDVDVFGMSLKEAVMRTRIIRDRKMAGDATYWMPAIAYRCLQYVYSLRMPEGYLGAAALTRN
jgi:hypothetical protein